MSVESEALDELRVAVSQRLDVLTTSVERLASNNHDLGERVHRTNNLVQTIITDAQLLLEMQVFLQRLIDVIEGKVDHLRKEVGKSTPPPPITEE